MPVHAAVFSGVPAFCAPQRFAVERGGLRHIMESGGKPEYPAVRETGTGILCRYRPVRPTTGSRENSGRRPARSWG